MSLDRPEPTDAELVRNAEQDPEAFGEIYRRHVSAVHGWLNRRAPVAASDLAAETFARAWLNRRSFHDERDGSALPWLLGIARNVLGDSIRRDRIETRARERLGLPTDLSVEDGFDAVDDRLTARVALRGVLERLPMHERRALELRVGDELSYDEVADRLSIRPAAARLRVSRALRRLARLGMTETP